MNPMVKSKVTLLPQAQSSLSREGSPVAMLDWPSDVEEAATSLDVQGHRVVYGSSRGEGSHPMSHPTDWMKQRVTALWRKSHGGGWSGQ